MRPGPAGLGSEEGRARTALAALGADGSGGKVIAAPESLGDSGGLECSAGEVGAHPDMRGEACATRGRAVDQGTIDRGPRDPVWAGLPAPPPVR